MTLRDSLKFVIVPLTLAVGGFACGSAKSDDPGPKLRRTLNDEFSSGAIAFAPSGTILAATPCGGEVQFPSGSIKLWDIDTGRIIATNNPKDVLTRFVSVAFSPDGKLLASGQTRGVQFWNPATGAEIAHLKAEGWIQSVVFSPDGKFLISGSASGTINAWDVATRKNAATLALSTERPDIHSLAISPNGKMLVSASYHVGFSAFGGERSKIQLWDTGTGKLLYTFLSQVMNMSVVFGADSKTLISGDWDKTIRIWDVGTKKNIATLTGHTEVVRTVALSTDGKTLASGSDDRTVKLWDLQKNRNTATLEGHSDKIHCVAFAPDGKTLASSSGDKTIKIWTIPTAVNVER